MPTINYKLNGQQIYLHYAGGYLAYSSHQQDLLSSLPRVVLKPFTKTQTRQEVISTYKTKEPEYGYERYERPDGKMSTRQVVVSEKDVEHDIEEMVTRDVTPKYEKFGSPILVGDSVALANDLGNAYLQGTITRLDDFVLGIGDQLFWWSTQNLIVIRQRDIVSRRR
jgi:hypothetical protein